MPVVPAAARHTIQDLGDKLIISVPSRKNWFSILFHGLWSTGWALGEWMVLGWVMDDISVVVGLFRGTYFAGPGLFMLAWFSLWTMAGIYVVYTLLWQLFGKEVLEVSPQAMVIRNVVLGFSRPREYSAEYIQDLRIPLVITNSDFFGFSRVGSWGGMTGGLIAFDYGSRTYRFGGGIDEAEAKQVIQEIQHRFPHYRNVVLK